MSIYGKLDPMAEHREHTAKANTRNIAYQTSLVLKRAIKFSL